MLKFFKTSHYIRVIVSSAIVCLTVVATNALAGETEDFVDKLKAHYKITKSIKTFSLNYHFLNKQYRDLDYWDYQTPNRIMSQRKVEVDLVNKHFYDNDILYTSGGRLNDYVQFQNDKESYSYERNGSYKGKRILNRGMGNFDRFKGYIVMNVDFLAVRPLLEETNIEGNITLHQGITFGTTTLTHKISDDNVIDYEFSNNPLQLVSINKKSKRAIYLYGDYQTTRGITFARSVHKYRNGSKEPNYINYKKQRENKVGKQSGTSILC
jgi:hypothetical protein